MGHLVPSIDFLKKIKHKLQQGNSVSQSIELSLNHLSDPFTAKVKIWWLAHQSNQQVEVKFKTHYQRTMISIFEEGIAGTPIYESLDYLEVEMLEEFERQWKLYLERLPSLLSLPLLFLFFPAYIILLFGPLLNQFLNGVIL